VGAGAQLRLQQRVELAACRIEVVRGQYDAGTGKPRAGGSEQQRFHRATPRLEIPESGLDKIVAWELAASLAHHRLRRFRASHASKRNRAGNGGRACGHVLSTRTLAFRYKKPNKRKRGQRRPRAHCARSVNRRLSLMTF
jgi:hypothetical protein